MKATDGRKLTGTFTAATSSEAQTPAIVLVTEPKAAKKNWDDISAKLAAEGIATLVLEVRAVPAGKALTPATYDVAGALEWLRARADLDPKRLLVAGAGENALVALLASASDPDVKGLALVSATLAPKRVDDEGAMSDFGARSLFVAVARGDKTAAKSSLVLDANAKGAKKIRIADGTRSAGVLLAGDAETLAELVRWARTTTSLDTAAGIEAPY